MVVGRWPTCPARHRRPGAGRPPTMDRSRFWDDRRMPSIAVTDKPEDLGLSSSRLARIGPFFEEAYVTPGRLPGVLTLVARRGQVASLACVGDRDLAGGRPVEADTIFRIYSMTKPITSVALMTLYEEGRFQLDDPVSRFLPELGRPAGLGGRHPAVVPDRARRAGHQGPRPADPHRRVHLRLHGPPPARCAVPAEGRRGSGGAGGAGGRALRRPGRDGRQAGRAAAALLARNSLELQRGHRRLRSPRRAAERAALRRVPGRADPRAAGHGRHRLLGHRRPGRPPRRPATRCTPADPLDRGRRAGHELLPDAADLPVRWGRAGVDRGRLPAVRAHAPERRRARRSARSSDARRSST